MIKIECPFADICATTRYWGVEKADYIKQVCETEEHKYCVHFVGLDANPNWVEEAREKMKNKEKRVFCTHVGDYILVDETNHVRGCVPKCPNKDSSSCPIYITRGKAL